MSGNSAPPPFITTLYGEMTTEAQRTHIRKYFPLLFVEAAKRDIRNFVPDMAEFAGLRSAWMSKRLCRMGNILRDRGLTMTQYAEELRQLERSATSADPMPALDKIIQDHQATSWKTLSVFVRDCVGGNCFPIDSRVERALTRHNLPIDERCLVALALTINRNPREIARMFYEADWEQNDVREPSNQGNVRTAAELRPQYTSVEQEPLMNERDFMLEALKEARKSRDEDDGRVHPRVGVVVARNGQIVAKAYRGEFEPGEHAEYTALERKLKDDDVSGATVYATLEPCTSRRHPKVPCAERLVERRIDRVVIGMLDPNREIRGRGEWFLFEHNVKIGRFDSDLMDSLKDLNRDFIRAQQRLGLKITFPVDGAEWHERWCRVKGTFVNPPGENVAAVTYVRGLWWPQISRVQVPPGPDNEWEVLVEFGVPEAHEVYIVQANELGSELIRYYRQVAHYRDEIVRKAADFAGRGEEETRLAIAPRFAPLSMARLPLGLDIEDHITVNVSY